VIGGGARSRYWGRLLATVLGRPLVYGTGGEVGPAFGAARLARIARTGETPEAVCRAPAVAATVLPEPDRADGLASRLARWRALYQTLRERFADRD
jgi:xylulokinase